MDVLISGDSVAGPTLAYWLAHYGHRPVVVERAPAPREGGYPIDVCGPAVRVAERMGILPGLRRAGVDMRSLTFVDAAGRPRAVVDTAALRAALPNDDVELPRGDLVRVLHEATEQAVEYVYDDSIASLAQDVDGVSVTFERGAPRRFDLVAGADGLHSNVRRLAFGDEAAFIHHLGYYVGLADVEADVDRELGSEDRVVLYNEPGRMAGVYHYLGRASAIFAFRHPATLPVRDGDGHRRALAEAFGGDGWRVPDLLAQVTSAPDFFFDAVSQVRMPEWSRGRVVLLGDAAHAPAFLAGQGTTLAMLGAYTLAGELHAAGGEHRAAFAAYEARHRPVVLRGQRRVGQGVRQLIPGTSGGIWRRDRLSRLLAVPAGLGGLLRRLPRRRADLREYGAAVLRP